MSVYTVDGLSHEFGIGPTQDGKGIVIWKGDWFEILTKDTKIQFNDKLVEPADYTPAPQPAPVPTDEYKIDGDSMDYGWGPTEDGHGIVVWKGDWFQILDKDTKIIFNDKTVDPVAPAPAPAPTPAPSDVYKIDGDSTDYGWGPTEDGHGIVVWKGDWFQILDKDVKIEFNDKTIEPASYEPPVYEPPVEDPPHEPEPPVVNIHAPKFVAEFDRDGNFGMKGTGLDLEHITFDVDDFPKELDVQSIWKIDSKKLEEELKDMGATKFKLHGDTTGKKVDFQFDAGSNKGSGFLEHIDDVPKEYVFTVHYKDSHGERQEVHICLHPKKIIKVSPVVLDLNQDGEIAVTGETSSIDKSDTAELGRTVEFDLDADGELDTIEWIEGNGDGMLVDLTKIDENGEIDGSALFGDEGGKYETGYEKLAMLDANADGLIAGDELSNIGLWIDDGDAVLESGELQTAAEAGLTSVSTEMEIVMDAEGRQLMQSEAEVNGDVIMTEDVWFAEEVEAHMEILPTEAEFDLA